MAEHGHDHLCGRARFCETSAGRLAPSVRLTIERQSSFGDRIAKPLTEAVDRERFVVRRGEDRDVRASRRRQGGKQIAVQRNQQPMTRSSVALPQFCRQP